MTVRKAVAKAEATAVKAQVFRFLRLVVLGVAAAYVSGQPLTVVAVVAVAEVAFRQAFPA
jgi:hypothetical protein